MKFFKKRESVVENLAFMGVSAALVGLFALASSFSVIASILLMLALPLLSALVAIICKWRYLPLFLIASIGVSTLLSFASFQNEIFFVIPSLFIGIVFGMLERTKIERAISLFLCALMEFGLFYLSMLFIKGLYEVDMIQFLLQLIGRKIDGVSEIIFPTFVLGYAFAQVAILDFAFYFVFSRFGMNRKYQFLKPFYCWIGIASYFLSLGLSLINPTLGYLFLGISIYWTVFALVYFFQKPCKLGIILIVIGIFTALLISSLMYKMMPPNTGLILYGSVFAIANIGCFMGHLVQKKASKEHQGAQ